MNWKKKTPKKEGIYLFSNGVCLYVVDLEKKDGVLWDSDITPITYFKRFKKRFWFGPIVLP